MMLFSGNSTYLIDTDCEIAQCKYQVHSNEKQEDKTHKFKRWQVNQVFVKIAKSTYRSNTFDVKPAVFIQHALYRPVKRSSQPGIFGLFHKVKIGKKYFSNTKNYDRIVLPFKPKTMLLGYVDLRWFKSD